MNIPFRRCGVTVAMLAASVLAGVVPAHAELVFFATGRNLSVRSHRLEGDRMVLELRGGGEMSVEASLITEVRPDEVPYPEPVAEVEASAEPAAQLPPAPARTLTVNRQFDPIIQKFAREKGVNPTLVRAVIQVESAYQPRARSNKGAVGLMQVMPATGRRYGIRNLYDPTANIRAGVTHLKTLLDRFPLSLALAAYNAGEATVERFAGIPPFPETIDYVARVRELAGL